MDASKLATCYNSVAGENSCRMKTAIFKIPENENPEAIDNLEIITKFDASCYGTDIKTTEFHPNESNKAVSLSDTHIILWDISEKDAKSIMNIMLEGKNSPKFSNGKWNPHQNCTQVLKYSELNKITCIFNCKFFYYGIVFFA